MTAPALAEFLLARWDEDEEVARAAMLPGNYTHYADSAAGECIEMALGEGCSERGTDHWRRHDPARVLAECEAKRRIVSVWQSLDEFAGKVGSIRWHEAKAYETVVRDLATVYADHPDYREEWKP